MELSTPAEQRAFAVAKLKRAASLPRMKDGRRPPMHVEAVSEGERSQLDRQELGADVQMSDDSPMMSETQGGDDAHQNRVEPEPDVETEHSEPKVDDPKTEEEQIISPPATPLLPEDTPTKSRRRSRSRSRGRSSKDFKGKAKAPQSPRPPNAIVSANDSSPDEGPITSAPQPSAFAHPPLISPIPAHFALLQAQRILASPEPGIIYPGTSPPTPMIPTLQDIQRGLFRSNSAAARLIALQQLAGPDTFDPSLASPPVTPPPLPKLARWNTVGGSGGERVAARRVMMRHIGKRLKEAEADQTSGGEDPQPAIPARRKRRSKRASANRSTVVDDREPPTAASPTTPVFPTPPLPLPTPEPARDISDPRNLSVRSPTPNARSPSIERSREDALAKLTGESPPVTTYDYESGLDRRGVVVEEEDDAPDHDHGQASPIPRLAYNGRSDTPQAQVRPPHASDSPSNASAELADSGVSEYMSESTHDQQDAFPTSPFATPLRERQGPDEEEEDSRPENDMARRPPWSDAYDREISWVAELVPATAPERIPVHDDNDYDDTDDTDEPKDHPTTSQPQSDPEEHEHEDDDESLPRASTRSKDLIVDIETSPGPPTPSHIPPSPSSAVVLHRHFSDDSRVFPARLSSPSQPELSSSNPEYHEWEESLRVIVTDTTPKKNGESSQRRWEKFKEFVRPGSSNGRRSRTNSIRERTANNTDSSTSRESGASITSPSKLDKEPASSYFPSSPGAVSPVPPASTETLLKYGGDAKLFPFPGIFPGVKRLEEERRTRVGGLSLSASSPDIASPPTLDEFSAISSGSASSRTPQASPEISRDLKLSHQASDTRLFQKFASENTPPALSSPSTSTTQPDPTSPHTPNNSGWLGGKLPTNREGVKKWLITKGLFPSQSTHPSLQQPILGPVVTSQSGSTDVSRKPSLSDLFDARKDSELMTDMSRTPTTLNENAPQSEASQNGHEVERRAFSPEGSSTPEPETPAHDKEPYDTPHVLASNGDAQSETYPAQSMSFAPDPNSSATPDPTSSLDDYASQSSPSSSSPERFLEPTLSRTPGTMILERLDEFLGHGSRGSDGSPFVDDPPRKLLLSSQVFQVANSNTVKDRFLFLFNDILVVAKPVTHDYDALLDTSKPSPLDRKFIVKSVAQLRDVRFTADRDDLPLSSFASISRNALVRTFVVQFTKDADHAISQFFEKTGTRDDPTVLGQLLFRMLDLDRAKMGDYLSRRTSKVVLKAFIGSFGFGGVRIDKALRVFLQSLHLAPSRYSNPLEYVSDSFASRWYDANADLVAYDKDLAIRLVRAVIQLNGVLYGGVVQDPWDHVQIKRNVTSRDFIDAFRRYDPRCLVPDELLDRIHASIRREPLSQARNSAHSTTPDQQIVLKRPIPSRLTYRMQSEPIIVRIPQVDPSLTIHLHGNELIFDPPYLSFTRSAEASFRITGTGLGLKTVSFSRSGPSALLYTGLPLSSAIVIERSFMRNTFQLAFVNHEGSKRRYMFSVDDPVMRYNWTVSLKRQIDIVSAGQQAQAVGPSPFHRAAEQIAFRVLQETLIPPSSAVRGSTPFAGQYFPTQPLVQPLSPRRNNRPYTNGNETSPLSHHVRSKSRSQVYPRHGPGKLEHQQLDLLLSPNGGDGTDSPETDAEDVSPPEPEGGSRLWGGKELEMICQQNSAIVLVLASSQSEPVHSRRPTPSPAPLRPAIPVQ